MKPKRKNINTPPYWDEKYKGLGKPERILYSPHKNMYEKICDLIFSFKHDKMVDVGAGTCVIAFLLEKRNFHFKDRYMLNIDHSKVGLEIGQTRLKETNVDIDIKVSDITKPIDMSDMEHQDNYDLVTCCEVLEHLTEPVLALKNMEKLVSDKGRVIVSVPHGRSPYKDHYWISIDNETMVGWHEAVGLTVDTITIVDRWKIFISRKITKEDAERMLSNESKRRVKADLCIPVKAE